MSQSNLTRGNGKSDKKRWRSTKANNKSSDFVICVRVFVCLCFFFSQCKIIFINLFRIFKLWKQKQERAPINNNNPIVIRQGGVFLCAQVPKTQSRNHLNIVWINIELLETERPHRASQTVTIAHSRHNTDISAKESSAKAIKKKHTTPVWMVNSLLIRNYVRSFSGKTKKHFYLWRICSDARFLFVHSVPVHLATFSSTWITVFIFELYFYINYS